jgi:predicted outer membrane repeat protein
MRIARGLRFAAMLALVMGFSLAGLNKASADHVPITIHAMECYTGVGAAIFEECHSEVDSGTGVFEDASGTATLVIPEDILADYLGAYIYCRDLTDDEVLFDGNYADTGGGAVIAVEDGDEIACDIYLITPAPKDDGGYDSGYDTGSTDSGGTTTVSTLPSTGSGAGADASSQAMLLIIGLLAVVATTFGLGIRRLER